MVVRGRRIWLRDWQMADVDEYRRWELPGQEWQKWDAPYEPSPTQEQIDQRIIRRLCALVLPRGQAIKG
jgi:hypothetical protein